MTKPQLRLIRGGKIDSPEWKIEPSDWVKSALFGTMLALGGTILRRTIKGRL